VKKNKLCEWKNGIVAKYFCRKFIPLKVVNSEIKHEKSRFIPPKYFINF